MASRRSSHVRRQRASVEYSLPIHGQHLTLPELRGLDVAPATPSYECVTFDFLTRTQRPTGAGRRTSSGSSSLVGGPAAPSYECVTFDFLTRTQRPTGAGRRTSSGSSSLVGGPAAPSYECVTFDFLTRTQRPTGAGRRMSSGSSSLVGGPAAPSYECVTFDFLTRTQRPTGAGRRMSSGSSSLVGDPAAPWLLRRRIVVRHSGLAESTAEAVEQAHGIGRVSPVCAAKVYRRLRHDRPTC